MFCSKCGSQVNENSNFCFNCGNNLKDGTGIEAQSMPTNLEQQTATEPNQFVVTAQHATRLRAIFNGVGYKHPNNNISKGYNNSFQRANVNPIDPEIESIIIHFGIGRAITDGIMASSVKIKRKDGKPDLDMRHGEIVITNKRLIILTGFGMFGSPDGLSYDFSEFKRVEPTEYQQYSQFTLYGKDGFDAYIDMKFLSIQAMLGQVFQMISNPSSGGNLVNYMERKDQAQATQGYINAHLAQARSLKQAFTELLIFLINPQA